MVTRCNVIEVKIKKRRRVQVVCHMECTGFEDGIYTGNEREECANNANQALGVSHQVSGGAIL